jgi:hypothetical protein
MSTRKSVSILALSLALAGGMIATPAFAADNSAEMMKMMDTNNNGKIEKDEYLAYQSKMFDKMAGTKGYITAPEAMKSFRDGFDFKLYGGG